MRTTLAIDDDILERIKTLAEARGVPVGRLVSALLRRQLETEIVERNDLPVFQPPANARIITDEQVRADQDASW